MRWITFFVLLYCCAALQHARLGALSQAPVLYPQILYIPMLAIFYALFAAEETAPLAGLACGLTLDALSQDPFGLYTVSLGLIAWTVVRIRMSIFREHAISQIIVVFAAVSAFGLVVAALLDLIPWMVGSPPGRYGFLQLTGGFLANGLYTGIVSPILFWIFFRFSGALGFDIKTGRKR